MKRTIILPLLLLAICASAAKDGRLSGVFSVAAERQVQFAQGNLQYQPSTSTWRMAEYQYDMCGTNNAHLSADYTGWVDLFGWGTGVQPTLSSSEYGEYLTYAEWGANAISNASNKAHEWRTLSVSEWTYLFFIRPNATALLGMGKVAGVCGVILLPDNWSTPKGMTFAPGAEQGQIIKATYSKNPQNNNFEHNTYTAEQWKVMEAAGAVFLPAMGYRYETDLRKPGVNGFYWSATPNPEDDAEAYNVDFDNAYLGARSISGRAWGMAVRLVCPPLPAEPEKPAPAEKKKPVLPPKGKMLKR